jgi:uncharacterized membrane protein YjjP (DUF1212 family)
MLARGMEANSGTPAAANAAAVLFLMRLARALHTYGAPVHQMEDALHLTAGRLGVEAQVSATPTSILMSFGTGPDESTRLLRLEPGENDLGRLAKVAEVSRGVMSGAMTPAEGSARLTEIADSRTPYPAYLPVLAFALSSACAATFLAGGAREIAAAALIGLLTGILAAAAARRPPVRRLFDPIAAGLASAVALAASHLVGPLSVNLATLAGIIILIPGLSLTVAVTELANRHLVAGTARLFGAFTVFVVIAVCVAIGLAAGTAALGPPRVAAPETLPQWSLALALLGAPLAFTVLLKAQPRDAPWILVACGVAFAGTRLGSLWLGPELGVFVGALVAGLAGSAYSAALRRPAAVVRTPAILLLVPGSVGFRSLTALLDSQVVPGVETAFKMITMAVALAAGLLVASVVAPTRFGR